MSEVGEEEQEKREETMEETGSNSSAALHIKCS